MRQPVQSDLIQRKLFDVTYHIYASPEYIARKGEPAVVDDLDKHNVIVYGDGTYSAYVYELDMLDAFNASNEPVLYAGPLNNDATMLWYFFRNARPRLTTCVVSAGAEG